MQAGAWRAARPARLARISAVHTHTGSRGHRTAHNACAWTWQPPRGARGLAAAAALQQLVPPRPRPRGPTPLHSLARWLAPPTVSLVPSQASPAFSWP